MSTSRATLRAALLLVAALLCGAYPAPAEPRVEYKLQAAYVSKFLRFVEWPDSNAPVGTFRVGVVGGAEFREAMSAMDGYEVGEGSVEVVRVDGVRALDGLHVLVLGPGGSEAGALALLRAARERPILTVSDAEDFNDEGGIVQFVVVDDAMRFQVNVAVAEQVELDVSSRLLRLAVKVQRSWSP